MRLFEKARHILYADSFVSKYKADDEHRLQRGVALIAAAAFIIMSILNVRQKSYVMLSTTSISAVFLIIGYTLNKNQKNFLFLKIVFYIIFIAIFTAYTIMGGNDGFAKLWIIIATYAVMIAIDFKAGFVIGIYYLVMLLLMFIGPLSLLLQYDYNATFMLRFPFLYAINFAFAAYIVIRIRMYQFEILMKQQELECLSTTDLSTGLKNRNSFVKYERSFQSIGLETLSAVFIDVNGLHEINNLKGHDMGDKMLCFVADLCKKYFADDGIYRMGGDEFLIISRNSDEEDIKNTVAKLYTDVEDAGYSISYGIETQQSDFNLDELVKAADAKMVKFKSDYYERTCRCKR